MISDDANILEDGLARDSADRMLDRREGCAVLLLLSSRSRLEDPTVLFMSLALEELLDVKLVASSTIEGLLNCSESLER